MADAVTHGLQGPRQGPGPSRSGAGGTPAPPRSSARPAPADRAPASGALSIVRFRPAGRRTRPVAAAPAPQSRSPRAIVRSKCRSPRRRAMPPRPRARASVAAHTRRDRSVSVAPGAVFRSTTPRSTHSTYLPVAHTPPFIASGRRSEELPPASARTRAGPYWAERLMFPPWWLLCIS